MAAHQSHYCTAVEYATVSASLTIEQHGLPALKDGLWNGNRPEDRLHTLELKRGLA
jgi:hypothetical protein